MPLLSLRHNQVLLESILDAWAEVILEWKLPDLARGDPHEGPFLPFVAQVIHPFVSGVQTELLKACHVLGLLSSQEEHEREALRPLSQVLQDLSLSEENLVQIRKLSVEPLFRLILERFAENFILFTMVPETDEARRVLRLTFDEPLLLRYRKRGYEQQGQSPGELPQGAGTYALRDFKSRLAPAPLLAALGLRPYRIHFPVGAAEDAASFHFEIDTPPGTRVVEAALIAGRPNEERCRPSLDTVEGGSPTVGLHVTEVPMGSLSLAQVELQVHGRAWLGSATVTCLTVSAVLLAAFLRFPDRTSMTAGSDIPVVVLMAIAGTAAGIVAQSDARAVAARLLSFVRLLSVIVAALPLAGAIVVAFWPVGARLPFGVLAAMSGLLSLLITAAWVGTAWRLRPGRFRTSPWEQGRDVPKPRKTKREKKPEEPPANFQEAEQRAGFDKPAVVIASALGWNREFEWEARLEEEFSGVLQAELRQESSSNAGKSSEPGDM